MAAIFSGSHPGMMNWYLKELGVDDETFGISDVLSLDEDFLHTISTPCVAILLLFSITPKYCEYWKTQEEFLMSEQEKLDDIYFMKQTAKYGDGVIALIHAVANHESLLNLQPDSVLKIFLNATRDLSPEEKGKYLVKHLDKHINQNYINQDIRDEVNSHFIAFVNVNSKLVELDGRKAGPILHGATSEEQFLKDAFRICREYMQREPENLNFTVLTFGAM